MTQTGPSTDPARSRRAGQVLAAAVLAVAITVLTGWYADVRVLTAFGPHLQRMVPNTALGLALLSGVLLVPQRRPWAARATTVAAALVAVLAVATLVEVEQGEQWALDHLVPGTAFEHSAGNMAPSTAVALALLGTSLALRRLARGVSQALAAAAFVGGYLAVLGYWYESSELYAIGGYTHMALPTALSISALSVAVQLKAPGSPLVVLLHDRGAAGRLVRGLLPFLLLAPPVVGYLRLRAEERGWFDTRFGVGLLVTLLAMSTTGLLLRAAAHVRVADTERDAAVAGLAGLNQDLERLVTQRTAALSAARARFEAAFASSPLGTALTSLEGRVEEVNRLLPRMTGRPGKELLGQSVESLFDDDLAEEDARLRGELLIGTAGTYTLERRLRREGAPCWVQVSVALVRDDSGAQALIHQLEDITARRLAEDRAEHLALHDALTDLPNRVLLLDRLRQALASAARSRRGVGVLFIDLDRFKIVNDSLGHHAGDLVLMEVARRLRRTSRSVDTVARLGGDEFVVLVTDVATADDVVALADVLREVVARPMDIEGTPTDVDASIGIAFGVGHEDPELLLRRADHAMYRAKDRGRARSEVFDDDLRTRITARLDTELALRGAVERGEVETWFQPIVDLHTDAFVAAEALVRWRRPERGVVLPGEFIHVAEETGLIKEIGTAVLRQALAHAAELGPGPAVSINVSARQFARDDFQAVVEEALADTGMPGTRLWLELTESALVEALDSAARSFQALREQGVRIAVDDFGTGFSSFSQLRHFPVDLLKVDMTFIADLTTSPRDRAIVEGILRMAEALHLDVVGEGIETPEQRDLLRIFGCRYGQGYLYARPAPALHAHPRDTVVPPQRDAVVGRVEQG